MSNILKFRKVKALTKVDMTRRPMSDYYWLLSQGFRIKTDGERIWLVR